MGDGRADIFSLNKNIFTSSVARSRPAPCLLKFLIYYLILVAVLRPPNKPTGVDLSLAGDFLARAIKNFPSVESCVLSESLLWVSLVLQFL